MDHWKAKYWESCRLGDPLHCKTPCLVRSRARDIAKWKFEIAGKVLRGIFGALVLARSVYPSQAVRRGHKADCLVDCCGEW
jgi:hypothetical protein